MPDFDDPYWTVAVLAPIAAVIAVAARGRWKKFGLGVGVFAAALFLAGRLTAALHRPIDSGVQKLVIRQSGVWVPGYEYRIDRDGRLQAWESPDGEQIRRASVKVSPKVFLHAMDLAEPARADVSYREDPLSRCKLLHHTIDTEINWVMRGGASTSASQHVHCLLGVRDYASGMPGWLAAQVGLSRGRSSWTVWDQRDAVVHYLYTQIPEDAWVVQTSDSLGDDGDGGK